jgi:hypothetical protein
LRVHCSASIAPHLVSEEVSKAMKKKYKELEVQFLTSCWLKLEEILITAKPSTRKFPKVFGHMLFTPLEIAHRFQMVELMHVVLPHDPTGLPHHYHYSGSFVELAFLLFRNENSKSKCKKIIQINRP